MDENRPDQWNVSHAVLHKRGETMPPLGKASHPHLQRISQTLDQLIEIEAELIRRVVKLPIDSETEKLIAEIQICTNRIQKQLTEMDEADSDKQR